MPPSTPPNAARPDAQQQVTLAAQELQANRLGPAESACRAALRSQPDHPVALQLLGLIAHRRQDYPAAIKHLNASLAQDNSLAPWHFNLGVSCRAAGQTDQAQRAYEAAIAIDPAYAAAHYNLGSVRLELGDPDAAFQSFRQTTRLDPNHANAHYQLGALHRRRGDIGKSVRSLRKAVALNPGDEEALLYLALALTESGGLDEAKARLEPLHQARPGWAEAGSALAAVYERLGHHDRAWDSLAPALKQDPPSVDAALVLANLALRLGKTDQAIHTLERLLDDARTDLEQQMLCHFALGRLNEQQADTDTAFQHFTRANHLKPASHTPAEHEAFVNALIEAFPSPRSASPSPTPTDSPTPIFIFGMPRSGTSLVEQVLASHPQVAGGGELPTITGFTRQVSKAVGSDAPYPQSLAALTPDHTKAMAHAYLARLRQVDTDAAFVTDKAPTNFLHLGLIARILPHAKIIHCRRNPVATCWSCYTQNFVGTHAYSYDLTHLADYYRQYERLMRHWRDACPIPILDVDYEALVADHQPQMRRLTDFCGLPWDDACLSFHENRRPMPTASYDQVRQPIYTAAVDRWRRYEAHLPKELLALDRSAA